MLKIDSSVARMFKQARDEVVNDFGLPSWMKAQCGMCRTDMGTDDLLEFGVCLTPQFLGDISCCFMCPNCNSLWEKHFQVNAISRQKLSQVLAEDAGGYEGIDKQTLLQQGSHNVSSGRTGKGMIKTTESKFKITPIEVDEHSVCL